MVIFVPEDLINEVLSCYSAVDGFSGCWYVMFHLLKFAILYSLLHDNINKSDIIICNMTIIFLKLHILNAGEVHCEQPNNSLYTFTGNLIINKQTLPLSPSQVLLRVWNCVFSYNEKCHFHYYFFHSIMFVLPILQLNI